MELQETARKINLYNVEVEVKTDETDEQIEEQLHQQLALLQKSLSFIPTETHESSAVTTVVPIVEKVLIEERQQAKPTLQFWKQKRGRSYWGATKIRAEFKEAMEARFKPRDP